MPEPKDFEDDKCEHCGTYGTDEAPLAICEGALLCEACCLADGFDLANFRDAMDEELRDL